MAATCEAPGRRRFFLTNFLERRTPTILTAALAQDMELGLPRSSPYALKSRSIHLDATIDMDLPGMDTQTKERQNENLGKAVARAILEITSAEHAPLERESVRFTLPPEEMAYLSIFNFKNDYVSDKYAIDDRVGAVIREILNCPCLTYSMGPTVDSMLANLSTLEKRIDANILSEVRLCCDFLLSGEIRESEVARASSWLRIPPFKPHLLRLQEIGFLAYKAETPIPLAGELIGGYLKKLIESVEGGLLIKPVCDLLSNLFEDVAGNPCLHPSAKPLIRALLRANKDREMLLRMISKVAVKIITDNNVQPKQLAVVFSVHDLQSQTGGVQTLDTDQDRLKVKREFDRWNGVWGCLMANLPFFLDG
ncbi:hypothetical protein HDU97_001246 [Phlyctochytrium planicorne]|nr:hypothetical protein HDU97_001246 [Phlyctochytrium planicorne]